MPRTKTETAKTEKDLTFETALAELPLEKSLASYKRGAELLQFCQRQLQDAQQQVKVLESESLRKFAGDEDQD